jgi:hypothetical protein
MVGMFAHRGRSAHRIAARAKGASECGGGNPQAAARIGFIGFTSGSIQVMVNAIALQPLIALVAGILILLMPRLLNYIVAIYLIVIGVTGLLR